MTFAPIGRMAEDTFVLWVHKNEGVNSLKSSGRGQARGSGWVMGGTGSAQEDQIITDFLNDTLDWKSIHSLQGWWCSCQGSCR